MSAKGVSTTAASVLAVSSAPSRGKLASLYYFADRTDYALVFTGCLFKLAFGATQGFVIVIFGDFFDVSPDKFEEAGLFFMQMMAILGAPRLALGLGFPDPNGGRTARWPWRRPEPWPEPWPLRRSLFSLSSPPLPRAARRPRLRPRLRTSPLPLPPPPPLPLPASPLPLPLPSPASSECAPTESL